MVFERLFTGKLVRNSLYWQFGFAIIGWIDSIYLIFIKYANNRAFCLPGIGDCYDVNHSSYSEISGIPIALLGALGYLAILLMLWLEKKNAFFQENSQLFVFGLSLIGVLYSAYLTYIEIAVLKAICPFCVLSAISMILIFVITTARLAKGASVYHL
jgi:uncharacterized membrane protein